MYTDRASPQKQQDQLQEPRSPTLLAGMHEPRELDVLCSTQYVARRRREEFQAWVCSKSQTPRRGDVEGGSADSSSHAPQDDVEERRAARFQLFKERQTAASAARVQSLEAVRARAAAFLARRERALAKVANAGEALGQALQRQMAAADERRSALLEAERCRLKQEHMLVLTTARLVRFAMAAVLSIHAAELSCRVGDVQGGGRCRLGAARRWTEQKRAAHCNGSSLKPKRPATPGWPMRLPKPVARWRALSCRPATDRSA
ncbi:hypothetical protein HaLaN_16952 [Haematococcus lacustris]|uniref:Uncharacterized protein n=1 Tax=Haematococcus lacustris TaxID=44745 RepID=A0A699ZF81_HAELA|nr:hypothetical protein HaLaN_16952 [Haematococcus lacustris]